jgi:hypothetical protein
MSADRDPGRVHEREVMTSQDHEIGIISDDPDVERVLVSSLGGTVGSRYEA